jgi:hypothetical protein
MRSVSNRGLVGISLALAVCLVAALPAMASAANVSLRTGSQTGTKLATGAAVKAVSSNLEFATSSGIFRCAKNELAGKVTKNNADPVEVSLSTVGLKGVSGGACATTIGGGAVTIAVTAENLPWQLKLTGISATAGKGTLTGTGGNIRLKFVYSAPAQATCVYEKASVADTFNLNGGALVLTLSGQTFTLNSGASTGPCPTSGTYGGTFAVTSGTSTVFATSP